MKKENESAKKMANAIATMRESGLKVTDETQKGGSVGITGVHDGGDGCSELGRPTKHAQAIAKLRASGLVVKKTAATKAGVLSIIGGSGLPAKNLGLMAAMARWR